MAAQVTPSKTAAQTAFEADTPPVPPVKLEGGAKQLAAGAKPPVKLEGGGGAAPAQLDFVGSPKPRAAPPPPRPRPSVPKKLARQYVDPVLGSFEGKRLILTRKHVGDVTQDALAEGVWLPNHVPLVCPSFASRDLAVRMADGRPLDFYGDDSRAGHDPWGICDYIRDSLHWPSESVFLDSECFGTYCHWTQKEEAQKGYYNTEARTRTRGGGSNGMAVGPFRVAKIDEKTDSWRSVKRNYRTVYTWAQRLSPVLLFFLSVEWARTPNCRVELLDVLALPAEGRQVVVAFLDPRAAVAAAFAKPITDSSTGAKKEGGRGAWEERCTACCSGSFVAAAGATSTCGGGGGGGCGATVIEGGLGQNLERMLARLRKQFDVKANAKANGYDELELDKYVAWRQQHDAGKKNLKEDLKEATLQVMELRNACARHFDRGDKDEYFAEARDYIDNRNEARILRLDVTGKPVRNRFLPRYQRRLDIHCLSAAQLALTIPAVGKVKAQQIVDYVAARAASGRGRLRHMRELEDIHGVGEAAVDYAEVSFTVFGERDGLASLEYGVDPIPVLREEYRHLEREGLFRPEAECDTDEIMADMEACGWFQRGQDGKLVGTPPIFLEGDERVDTGAWVDQASGQLMEGGRNEYVASRTRLQCRQKAIMEAELAVAEKCRASAEKQRGEASLAAADTFRTIAMQYERQHELIVAMLELFVRTVWAAVEAAAQSSLGGGAAGDVPG